MAKPTTTQTEAKAGGKGKKTIGGIAKKARRAGGYVSRKSERGSGMKFKVETYATVAQFQPGTRIKYGPNPKRPGSKSFARYAGYQRSKTVGESLKNGATMADFMWELERGDYRVLGGVRSEEEEVAALGRKAFDRAKAALASKNGPNGCPVKFSDENAVEKLRKEEAWRTERLARVEGRAKSLGLRVESTEEIEASTESADIRLQRRVAEAIAERKLAAGKKIVDADVREALEHWGFGENSSRVNVMPEGHKYVYSDTIGAIRARSFGYNPTPPTRRYPKFAKLLNRWLADNRPPVAAKFVCSAINLNCNYNGRRHRDQNNEGPSVIRAFGKFTGGKLRYWPKDTNKTSRKDLSTLKTKEAVVYDLAKKTVVFNGNKAHEVDPFEGNRYSVVFFTASGYAKAKPRDVKFLREQCGFAFPTAADVAKLRKATN